MCPYLDDDEKYFVPCKDDHKEWYEDCKAKGFPYIAITADTWGPYDYFHFCIKEKTEVFDEIAEHHDIKNYYELVEIYNTGFEFEEQNRNKLIYDTSSALMYLPKEYPINATTEKLLNPIKYKTQPQPYPLQEQLGKWFKRGSKYGMKYLLIVKQSSFFSEYYPFYVNSNNNLFTTIKYFQNRNECKVVEVYNLNYDFFLQYQKCLLSIFDSRGVDSELYNFGNEEKRTEITDFEYFCYVIREYISWVSMNEGFISPMAMGAAFSLIKVASEIFKKQPKETIAATLKAFCLLNARFLEVREMIIITGQREKYVNHYNIYQIPIMVVLLMDQSYFHRIWPEIKRKLLHDDPVLHSFAENCLYSAREVLKSKLSFFDTITAYIERQRNFNKLLSLYWISDKADEYYPRLIEKWPQIWEKVHQVKPDPAIFKKSDALSNLFEEVEWLLKQYDQMQLVYPQYIKLKEFRAQIEKLHEKIKSHQ